MRVIIITDVCLVNLRQGCLSSSISGLEGFSIHPALENFGACFLIAFAGLVPLAFLAFKPGSGCKTFVFIWSLFFLVLTFAVRRFAYYYAVNAALLTAFFVYRGIRMIPRAEPKALVRARQVTTFLVLVVAGVNLSASFPAGGAPFRADVWRWRLNGSGIAPEPFHDSDFYYNCNALAVVP